MTNSKGQHANQKTLGPHEGSVSNSSKMTTIILDIL